MENTTKNLLKRLVINYVLKHKIKLIIALICMIIVSASTAIHAWMMQPVLDDIFLNKNSKMLFLLPIAILVIAIIKGLASYFQSIFMNYIGFKIVADVQSEMFLSLIKCDLSYFNENNSDQQQRFITLIDIIYENKIPILVSSNNSLNNLNSSASLSKIFKRTISRLYELTSVKIDLP